MTLVLLATSVVLALLMSLAPVFGFAALIVLLAATAHGAVHGSASRAVVLAVWSFICLNVALLVIHGPTQVALAVSAALGILAVTEAIRALLGRGAASREAS